MSIFKRFKRTFWISVIVIIHLLFSYYFFKGWWYSGIGTILILTVSYLFCKEKFLKEIGLRLSLVSFFISIILAVFAVISSFIIIKYIGDRSGAEIQFTKYGNYIHDIFYTLNEEIILGAILLFNLSKKIKVHPLIISAGVAVIFSLIHFVFYKWIFLQKGIIATDTLFTLFLVGFFRNNLILKFKHIGYSWAFHFGWMAVMFGSYHYYQSDLNQLTQVERFNLYLGSSKMLITAAILAIISMGLFRNSYPLMGYFRTKRSI
jgi:hypothetical protein